MAENRRVRIKSEETFSEIICIIDRSGSMGSIVNDAIGGFNTFLEEQKELPGKATLTFVQFDTEYEVVHESKPIQDVPILNSKTYKPRGGTALLDAIGKTINDTERRLSNMLEESRPDKVIIAILTDGEENSSKKYSLSEIKEKISLQKEKHKWEFIYLGANQDAFAEAAKLGIAAKDSFNYMATGIGIRHAFSANMGAQVASYRTK